MQSAVAVLDRHYIEMRHRLLDLAAALDRIDRGGNASDITGDQRLGCVHDALRVLSDRQPNRAERVQQLFSLKYDPNWR